MATQPVLTDMNDRLEAAAREVSDTRAAYEAAMELRNQLVVAAVNAGMSQRAVAKAAKLSPVRISSLLLLDGVDPTLVDEV